jgi:DNA-binding XRE family transcriptional regulator
MKHPRLQNVDIYFKEQMKDPEFKRMYEVERVKVALAQKIAELRDRQHLNQSQLAKKMNVSQQFISQLENGDKANVTLETLAKIAKSLNMAVEISFKKLRKTEAVLRVV